MRPPPAPMSLLTSPRRHALGRQAHSVDFFEFVPSRGASNVARPDRARSARRIGPEPQARIGAEAEEGTPQVQVVQVWRTMRISGR